MSKNILLIVIDQFRADCVLGELADAAPLPNLQALMQEATCFKQHYTVTTPCGPSRASLLTGLYAMNHRSVRNGTPLGKQHLTIGHRMRRAGYEPLLFGYTDVSADPNSLHANDPDLKDYEGLAPGFAEVVRQRLETPGSWVGYLKNKGYSVPTNYWDLYKPLLDESTASEHYPAGSPIRSPALYSSDDSDTAYLTDRTLEPLVAPAPFNTRYHPKSMPTPKRRGTPDALKMSHPFFAAQFDAAYNRGLFQGFDGEVASLNDHQVAELRAIYLGLAFEVDRHIGRVIHYLKTSKQYDDTLIIVTADHGEMLGDQWMWGKNAPFDAALHIPLIIRDPRQAASFGTEVSLFTESIDIAPTLVDWVASEPSFVGLDGSSLLPLLAGETPEQWRKHTFSEAELGDPLQASRYQTQSGLAASQANYAVLRSEDTKYVHFNGGQAPMLFDVQNDPHELHNLAADAASNDTLQRCATAMIDHRMTYASSALSNSKLTATGLKIGD